mmetsp:Transcript_781/g.1730  ORF Transcript_781/g.1730 Transcript_781/m.1730 type:complete len:226 (+) Transcript_781:78-755(+)
MRKPHLTPRYLIRKRIYRSIVRHSTPINVSQTQLFCCFPFTHSSVGSLLLCSSHYSFTNSAFSLFSCYPLFGRFVAPLFPRLGYLHAPRCLDSFHGLHCTAGPDPAISRHPFGNRQMGIARGIHFHQTILDQVEECVDDNVRVAISFYATRNYSIARKPLCLSNDFVRTQTSKFEGVQNNILHRMLNIVGQTLVGLHHLRVTGNVAAIRRQDLGGMVVHSSQFIP